MKKYNLLEFTNVIKEAAEQFTFVNTVLFDRYKIDNELNIKFPIVTYLINSLEVYGSHTNANISIIYCDRLTDDSINERMIQSLGTQVITEVINGVRDNFDIDIEDGLNFNYFTEQYADNAAGAIANNVIFTFASDISDCSNYCINSCYKNGCEYVSDCSKESV